MLIVNGIKMLFRKVSPYVYCCLFCLCSVFNLTYVLVLQMDNRGNRIIVSDTDSAINTPAIGAAHVVNSYAAKAPDELSLEVTVSIVLMNDNVVV